jgi:hypothetical protein
MKALITGLLIAGLVVLVGTIAVVVESFLLRILLSL